MNTFTNFDETFFVFILNFLIWVKIILFWHEILNALKSSRNNGKTEEDDYDDDDDVNRLIEDPIIGTLGWMSRIGIDMWVALSAFLLPSHRCFSLASIFGAGFLW